MAFGQNGLDGGLTHQQPVERGVKFVVIDRAETERFAEAGGGRVGREGAGGGELGDGVEDATDQNGQDKVPATIAVGAEGGVEADPARGAEGGGDMAVRQAAGDGEGVLPGRDDGATFEQAPKPLDMGSGPIGEIAQRTFMDLAIPAVALAQQDRGR